MTHPLQLPVCVCVKKVNTEEKMRRLDTEGDTKSGGSHIVYSGKFLKRFNKMDSTQPSLNITKKVNKNLEKKRSSSKVLYLSNLHASCGWM